MPLQTWVWRCCGIALFLAAAGSSCAQNEPPPDLSNPIALPDGSVVFSSNMTSAGAYQSGSDVYRFGFGGLQRITVQPQPASGYVRAFDRSPDGSRLAVATDGSVSIVNLATGAQQVVSTMPHGGPLHFSPDGATLIFSVPPNSDHLWFPFLYSVPAAGGTPVRLTRGAIDGRYPFADDGTLVFTSPGPADTTVTTSAPANVYTMKLDGSGIRQLTQFTGTTDASQACISRDGKRVLFLSQIPKVAAEPSVTVWVAQSDGSGMRSLPVDPAAETVAFSSDGSLTAWSLNGQIHLVNVDVGKDSLLLAFQMSDIAAMEFAPNNSRIYFLLGEPDGNEAVEVSPSGSALWSVDLPSGTARQMYAPRTLSPGGIIDPIVLATTLTPGGLVTVYGTNLTTDSMIVSSTFPLPQVAGGVSLLVNGQPAGLLAVTPWQVNAQIPMDTPPGTASFSFRFADGTTTQSVNAPIVATAPHQLGANSNCAFHAGTAMAANNAYPASPGEVLEMYGYGLGATSPIVPVGALAPASPPATLANHFGAAVRSANSSQTADVLWAGLSPGSLDLYQVNVRIPPQTPPGSAGIFWSTDTVLISGGCAISVR